MIAKKFNAKFASAQKFTMMQEFLYPICNVDFFAKTLQSTLLPVD
jgi:hypothetical protein